MFTSHSWNSAGLEAAVLHGDSPTREHHRVSSELDVKIGHLEF